MKALPERPADVGSSASFTPPYPPSWVDRLIGWIGRLPGPAWVFYVSIMVGLATAYLGKFLSL